MGLTLALDSSQRWGGSVALARGEELVAEVFHDPRQGYAESFFPLADAALASAGAEIEDLESFAVVTGPGSFTGLRIGVMSAKSLAFALGRPLFAATSLSMLAIGGRGVEAGDTVLALLEAGRDAVYAAAWTLENQRREPCLAPGRLTVGDLMDSVRGLPSPRSVVALGRIPGGEEHAGRAGEAPRGEAFESLLEELAAMGFSRRVAPSLASTLALRCEAGDPWCPPADPATLLPVYLGLSQAERVHGLDLSREVHRRRPPQT